MSRRFGLETCASRGRFRGRNGETGLNPFRCLVKLDTYGLRRHSTAGSACSSHAPAHKMTADSVPIRRTAAIGISHRQLPRLSGIARIYCRSQTASSAAQLPFSAFASAPRACAPSPSRRRVQRGPQRVGPVPPPRPKVLNGRSLWTAHRTLHAPRARVPGAERRDREGPRPRGRQHPHQILTRSSGAR